VPKLPTLIPTRLLAPVLAPAVIRSRAAVPLVVWLAAVVWLGGQSGTRGEEAHAAAQNLILARCVECHGVDAKESNLRLDSRAAILRGGDFGPAAVAGKADTSELVRRVKTTNPEQMMPPDGERLPAEKVAALAAWIDAGLPWPGREAEPEGESVRDPRLDHWAWQPIMTVLDCADPSMRVEKRRPDQELRTRLADAADVERDHGPLATGMARGAAALIQDLDQRGLLDDTLVLWTTEFGRMPSSQGGKGRDHNPFVFTNWLCGGGIKGGITYGESDQWGYKPLDRDHPTTVHDVHATVMKLLGIDHTKLTWRNNGIDRRLTDVHGHVIDGIL